MGLLISGQLSHASPTPSLSRSVCIGFGTLGQLSSTFWIPAKHPHTSHTQMMMILLRLKVEQFIKMNSLYHLHRCLHRKSLPLHYCRYLSGQCWERWDSYHTRHRMNRCRSSADLYWTPTDSCPETYTFIHRETYMHFERTHKWNCYGKTDTTVTETLFNSKSNKAQSLLRII